MSKIPHPIILMGDMNAVPKDDEIAILREFFEARGGEDCTHELGPTFHNYGRLDKDRSVKIDYIFADKKASNAFIVEDIPVNVQYYSYHNAVCATIEI
jgi:endonuclease/exonuclease/phosphatase family metal-dependent hydrolase